MKDTHLRKALCALCITLASGAVLAQEADSGIEIMRDAVDLQALLKRPVNQPPNILNTALVLTNQIGAPARVNCVAYDQRGQAIGRAWTRVPGNGTRVMLASDISYGANFVGNIDCHSAGEVVGAAFIVGAAFSDTLVTTQGYRGSHIRVQAAVNY